MLRRKPGLLALLDEPYAALALLARDGRILHANDAFRALAGAAPALPAAVRAALDAGRPCACEATIERADGPCPAAFALALTGLRSPAAVLRLTDLRPHTHMRGPGQVAQAQRLAAVGQLAAGIAHDFNNLLSAILGAAEALAGEVTQAGEPDRAQIQCSAERGAALVRQLLAFGAEQTLQPKVVNLNAAVREAASMLGRVLDPRITLAVELDEPGRDVCIDPTQLNQVIMNLALNARDAMKEGGRLTLATGRRLLLAPEAQGGFTIPPGRYAVLEVRDTGAGIAASVLPRIFEPFFTTKRANGGTGLGLATVHGIVRQSRGYLTVESTEGVGTVFRVLLLRHETPLNAPAPLAPTTAQAEDAAGALLLVEDEAPVRHLVARALGRAGWQVRTAASAEEALDMDVHDVGQVVSDVMMPGMDGPNLVRRLRERRPGLRAVLISGYADAAQRQALNAEDIAFLAKPFAMKALLALVGGQKKEDSSFSEEKEAKRLLSI